MSDTMSAAKTEDKKITGSPEGSPGAGKLPVTGAFDVESAKKAASGDSDSERNEVLTSLVTGDADIVGLVAYSIYKQNKHDWLVAFNKQKGHEPDENEVLSYIIGESTPRRLATYHYLAEATLDGRGPKVNMGPSSEKFVQRSLGNAHSAQPSGSGGKLAWIVAAVIALAAILAAGKFGLPGLR